MQSVILNLTEHPYAATYSSSQAKKKTLTGRKRDVSPEAVRIILGAAQMTAAGASKADAGNPASDRCGVDLSRPIVVRGMAGIGALPKMAPRIENVRFASGG